MHSPLDVRIISNLAPPDWWTIGLTGAATILGAVIGVAIAYVVARQTAKENRDFARIARCDAEEAATLRAEVKLLELTNSIAGYRHIIENGIAHAKMELESGQIETWLAMRSVAGRAQEIHIDAGDLIAFTRAREFEHITKLLFFISRYNTVIYAVEEYGKQRDELLSMITPTEMSGLIGTIAVTEEKARQIAPYIAAVNDLGDQVRSDVNEVFELAIPVLDGFGPIVRKYFDDPKFPIPGRTKTLSTENEGFTNTA